MDLAIQILDGAPLRPGGKIPMSVTKAKFEQKGNVWNALFIFSICFWILSPLLMFDSLYELNLSQLNFSFGDN